MAWFAALSDVGPEFSPWPNSPANFHCQIVSGNQLLLTWNPSDFATGYQVERRATTNGTWTTIGLLGTGAAGFADAYITNTYSGYRIVATNQFGQSLPAQLEVSYGGFRTYQMAGNESAGNVKMEVWRSGPRIGSASVDFQTEDITAVAGQDYVATNGTLVFASGQEFGYVTIRIIPDLIQEEGEIFTFRLTNPSTGSVLDNYPPESVTETTVYIHDSAPPEFRLRPTSLSAIEGSNVVFTVIRTNGSFGPATVRFATSDGTASAGQDYLGTNGILLFSDGQTNATVTIALLSDGLIEPDEAFTVGLSDPTNAIIGIASTASVLIQESQCSLSFQRAEYVVEESSGGVLISVNRAGRSNGSVGVNLTTTEGTAEPGTDYTPTSATLIFAPGDTVKGLYIPILPDSAQEGEETVRLTLSSPTGGAILGTDQAQLTIVDSAMLRAAIEWPNIELFWRTNFSDFHVESASDPLASWETITNVATTINGIRSVIAPLNASNRFFRLAR